MKSQDQRAASLRATRSRARSDAYGLLPRPGDQGAYTLPLAYMEQAERDVALQLSRAGVRLAMVLNHALAAAQN